MTLSKHLSRLVRVVIALAIVVWLVTSAGVDNLAGELAQAETIPLLMAFLAMAGEVMLRSGTWSLLLRAICPETTIAYKPLLSAYVTSSMLGYFVPSSAGTDVLRAGLSHRMIGGHFVTHLAAVVMQNAVSFFAVCLLGLLGLGLLWLQTLLPRELVPLVPPLVAIVFGVPLAYLFVRARRGTVMIAMRRVGRRWFRLRRSLRRFLASVLVFQHAHAGLGLIILCSTAAILSQSLAYALAAKALGITLPAGAWILLPAVIAIAGLLPASFLGFGAIQAANVFVVSACGIPLPQAVALAALIAVMNLTLRAVAGGTAMLLYPPTRLMSANTEGGTEQAKNF